MEWLINVSPQHWLIHLCNKAKDSDVISGYGEETLIVRISDRVIAKFGSGVQPSEAATQKHAYRHLSCRTVRVPEVYRFFQDRSDRSDPKASRPVGYLFMEYISGNTLHDVDLGVNDVLSRLSGAIAELGKLKGHTPGPVGGGTPHGSLWSDDSTEEFGSLDNLNRWLNKRLEPTGKMIDLRPYPLVLCHLDLCSRNIRITDGGSVCLLGWGHAGFFPRSFEIAAASCVDDEASYAKDLLKAVQDVMKPTVEEKECVDLILKARDAGLRYL